MENTKTKIIYSIIFIAFILGSLLYENTMKEPTLIIKEKSKLGNTTNNNDFYQTPEGIKFLEENYLKIDNSTETSDILEFAKTYNLYKELFINGELNYEKLLHLAVDKNSKEALSMLYEFYLSSQKKQKALEIKEQIKKSLYNKENPKDFDYLEDNYEIISDETKEECFKEILNTNDITEINNAALFLTKEKNKAALQFFNTLLTLQIDDESRANIYSNISYIYSLADDFKIQKIQKKF